MPATYIRSESAHADETARNPLLYPRMIVLFLLGCAYLILIPPFEAPDEPSHLFRAHGVAEGQFMVTDHSAALVRFVHENMKTRRPDNPLILHMERLSAEPRERTPNIAWNTALYSPAPYVFHAGVIKAIGAVGASTEGFRLMLYGGRLTTLCLFILFIFLASRLHPESSWILFWIAAAPMALAQASVVTMDVIVIGAAAILLATSPGHLPGRTHAVCLVVSSFFLLMAKPTYFPLLLIPAVLSIRRRADGGRRIAAFLLALAISGAGAVAWNGFAKSRGVFLAMAEAMKQFTGLELNPGLHLELILSSPLEFLGIVGNTLATHGLYLMHQFVGVLGWLEAPVPLFTVVLWWLLAIPAILISGAPGTLGRMEGRAFGLASVLAAVSTFFLIFISVFMYWNPVGSTLIGVQGRYFHVVALVLFTGVTPWIRWTVSNRGKRLAGGLLIGMAVVINVAALYTVYSKFRG